MISSHCDHYADHPPHYQGGYEQDSRCQTVVIQQGPGPYPYGTTPGSTVVIQQGLSYTRVKGKGVVALGAFLLIVSFVLLICGALFVTGAIGGLDDFFRTPVSISLFGFGGIILLAGLCFIIPAARYEINKNKQRHQTTTGDQTSTGPDQPRLNPPTQPYYQPSYQPSYQQGSNIPGQPYQPNPSYPLGSAIPPQHFQPIPPSTDPPPYTWSSSAPYSNVGFTSSADREMGYTKATAVH